MLIVLISPKDELVSFSGINSFIQENTLTTWHVETVSNHESTLERPYAHLLLDPPSVGQKEWERMLLEIKQFLK